MPIVLTFASTLLISSIIGDAHAQTQGKAEQTRDLFQTVEVAFQHCKKLEAIALEPYKIVEAYQNHFTNVDFERDLTGDEQLDLLQYFEGRKNIPDFGFIIPAYSNLMPRVERIKFNALMSKKVLEGLEFTSNNVPFIDNCTAAEFKDSGENEISLDLLFAFADEKRSLQYLLRREDGYAWEVVDMRIEGGDGLLDQFSTEFSRQISASGFAGLIENLCKASEFSKLGCGN